MVGLIIGTQRKRCCRTGRVSWGRARWAAGGRPPPPAGG